MKIDAYAVRLLRFRPRSVAEMRGRLKNKGFKNDEITQTLRRLQASGLLDDCQFAKFWAKERELAGYGIRRIRWELKAKGVNDKLIDDVVSEFEAENNEYTMAKTFTERKLKLLEGKDGAAKRRRLYGALLRKGFSGETIEKIISSLHRNNDLQ